MNKLLFVICLFFVFPVVSFAQDTIYLDKKVQYFSKDGITEKRTKGFPRKTARELIQLPNNTFKIEQVCYLDKKRLNYGNTENFKIIHNSLLITDRESWNFKKISNNKFSISNKVKGWTQNGTAYSLVPLIMDGKMTFVDSTKTISFTALYKMGEITSIDVPQVKINGSIYLSNVDKQPEFYSKYGDLFNYLRKRSVYYSAQENDIQARVVFQVVITSTGDVKNVKIVKKSHHQDFDLQATKTILNLPKFEPAKVKGENVNCVYYIPVSAFSN